MSDNHFDLIVIGAGPAGVMSAIHNHDFSKKIIILEKMERPLKKLKISGKGRCNITNSAPLDEFLSHFNRNGLFLKYSFHEFFSNDLLDFFKTIGVEFKLERGGRYFAKSDNACDVADALVKKLNEFKIPLRTNKEVVDVAKNDDGLFLVTVNDLKKSSLNEVYTAEKVVLATGGKSYPKTGSTGDGYRIAKKLGHTIIDLTPSLVPLKVPDGLFDNISKLTLRNVNVTLWCSSKKRTSMFGEMMIDNNFVEGPVLLLLSRVIVPLLKEKQEVSMTIDFKPALTHDKLDKRLQREIHSNPKNTVSDLLRTLLPSDLVPVFLRKLNLSEDKPLHQFSGKDRQKLKNLLKSFSVKITDYGSFNRAIVTSGGISTKEISTQTMESKLVKGLFFAGEIIDVDADTGGYNFQAAFSTGYLAGQ